MSVTLYIALERPIAGVEPNDDRTLLCRIEAELADIAKRIGQTPLTAFYSYDVREVIDFVDDEVLRQQMLAGAKPPAWFDAEAALGTATAIREYVVAHGPVIFNKRDVTSRVLDELDSCIRVLTAAKQAGVRFRMHPGE